MRYPWRFSVLALLMVVLVAISSAEEQVLLRLRLPQNTNYRYGMTTVTSQRSAGQFVSYTMASDMIVEVKGVTARGTTVVTKMADAKVTDYSGPVRRKDIEAIEKTTDESSYLGEYDELGNALSLDLSTDNPIVQKLATGIANSNVGFMGFVFPKNSIKVGSKWSTEVNVEEMMTTPFPGSKGFGDKKMKINFKVEAINSRDGQTIVSLSFHTKGSNGVEIPGPRGQKPLKTENFWDYTGTAEIDASTGLPIAYTTNGTTRVVSQIVGFEQSMQVVAELKPEAAEKPDVPLIASDVVDVIPPHKQQKFDPNRDAAEDIAFAIQLAKLENKRIILDVGGEWCGWCKKLDKFFKEDEEVAEILEKHFLVIKVNFSEENKNEEVLSKYPKIAAYPHLFVLDKDGSLLHSQDTGKLETGDHHDHDKVIAFLKQWIGS